MTTEPRSTSRASTSGRGTTGGTLGDGTSPDMKIDPGGQVADDGPSTGDGAGSAMGLGGAGSTTAGGGTGPSLDGGTLPRQTTHGHRVGAVAGAAEIDGNDRVLEGSEQSVPAISQPLK